MILNHLEKGAAPLGNRGRRPVNSVDLDLAQTTYLGFTLLYLTGMLAEPEEIHFSRPTLPRVLQAAEISSPRQRSSARAYHRRDRMAREGRRLQVDGSRHEWLEGRAHYLTLVSAVDDATERVVGATSWERDDAQGYFPVLHQALVSRGVSMALYSDRHVICLKTEKP